MLRPTVTQGSGEGNVNEIADFCIGEEIDKEHRASPAADTTQDDKVEHL